MSDSYDPYGEVNDEWEESVVDLWLAALRDAWHVARGARLAELRADRRIKSFDSQGLHAYSAAWGRVVAFERLLPALQDARLSDPGCDPVSLRRIAERDAQETFSESIRKGEPGLFS